jgi:uncharacterized membrane protein YidH (DUF202 family)
MLWKYALALTLSGFAMFAFVILVPSWGHSWSMAFLAQLLVDVSIVLWIIALVRWLMGK